MMCRDSGDHAKVQIDVCIDTEGKVLSDEMA
jgi:hypothetical protein